MREIESTRRRLLAAGATLLTGLSLALAMPGPSLAAGTPHLLPAHSAKHTSAQRRAHASPQVNVSVDPHAVLGAAVPEDFLGLSFELSGLPDIAGYAASGDLVNLMQSLGPGVMRFGGISADTEAAWLQEGLAPTWAHVTIGAQQLAGVASLARATGWHVLLTVNFGHDEPAAAAQEARAAQSLLGSSLAGIAIGNEPDRYVADGLRTSPWSFADYLTEAGAYRTAIAAAAPGVPIVGPDASSGGLSFPWDTETATAEHPALLTEHYYPLTKCQAYAPKLADLLSPLTRVNETAVLTQLSTIARTSAIPLRIDETNNVSCRGQPGVSDVFASALWAVDYVARAMASGVAGLNFHDLIGEPETYSPLVALDPQELASGELHANPEWYALLLARSLLGDEPVQAAVAGGERTLTARAFVSPSGSVHVVLVNFTPTGARPALVRLRVPRQLRAGTILRLTAPGLRARTGVTLGGRSVSDEGTWSPATALPRVSSERGTLELSMPASSAALVTLYPGR
jgi:hypothetical protein